MGRERDKPDEPPTPGWDSEHEDAVITESERQLKEPRLFNVILHNDHYTTMEFVVMVLMNVFHHPEPEAVRIMLKVHEEGAGIAGTFSYEVAETKAAKVEDMARQHEFPLRCSVEAV